MAQKIAIRVSGLTGAVHLLYVNPTSSQWIVASGFRAADPCCNATSCRYMAGCQCANYEPCCSNGVLVSAAANQVCRASTGSCDVAEKCNGWSGVCPVDLSSATGTSCGTGAVCYNGKCMPSFNSLCNAKTGTNLGYCDQSQDECQPYGNVDTGLWCLEAGGRCTISGDFYAYGSPDGTSCGSGLMCSNNLCRASSFAKTYQWSAGQWTACSASSQSRTVSCVDEAGNSVAVRVGIVIASLHTSLLWRT